MAPHYEIERKYLVRMPELPIHGTVSVTDIAQTYLIAADGASERVRARGGRYYHTIKYRVSGIKAEERETEITRSEYETLLNRKDPACAEIKKTRHVFEYMGQIFELDIFPFWKKQAMMEIEIESESTLVTLPPFLDIICEVTDDHNYKNHTMAKSVPNEMP